MSFGWFSRTRWAVVLAVVVLGALSVPGQNPTSSSANFAPLEQWKSAVVAGDTAALNLLYSANPAAQVTGPGGGADVAAEVGFWSGLKAGSIDLDVLQSVSPQAGVQQVVFQAAVKSKAGTAVRTVYVEEGQLWQQQGEQWRITAAKRTDVTRLQQPTGNKDIYEAGVDAKAEIKAALGRALSGHKRVLLVFGANWCYDCHVLDLAFQRAELAPVLQKHFEVVHVDVGQGDKNQDLMQLYGVPMAKGIPGLAVLDSDGKLLYSQKNGEFEKARALAPEDLLQFLNKWKPQAR
jgi:hypothetical protein